MWRWVLFLLVACAGCGPDVGPEEVPNNGAAAAAFAFTSVVDSASKPEPKPDSDKCENCDGKGKVGDGRVMVTCKVCSGTGKKVKSAVPPAVTPPDLGVPPEPTKPVEPVPEPKPEPKPKPVKRVIGVFTRDPCPACDKWLVTEGKTWEAKGYEVVKVNADPAKTVPYFRVKDEHVDLYFKNGLTWAGYVLFLEKKEKP